MNVNQFVVDNLKEGDSCKEMIMGDGALFTQNHYDTIKEIIEKTPTLTHVATRIYFRQSSVNVKKIKEEKNEPIDETIGDMNFCEVTILTSINRDISPHLATCDIIEKIFNFIKPVLQFH